jgi:hypothetical protein
MVVGAACYLGARDKLDSLDLVIILSALGGGVSVPWLISRLIGARK